MTQRFRLQSFLRDPRTLDKTDEECVDFLAKNMKLDKAGVASAVKAYRPAAREIAHQYMRRQRDVSPKH